MRRNSSKADRHMLRLLLTAQLIGAYSGAGRLGARPPWIFRILKKRALSLTTAIEKQTKRKKVREKEEIYRFWSYDGKAISVYPLFSLFFIRNSNKTLFFLTLIEVYKCLVNIFFLFS